MQKNNAAAIESVKNICEELLQKMNVEATVNARIELDEDTDGESTIIHIQSELAHLLIGQAGGNMGALQHIVRMLYRKRTGEPLQFTVDVNNYRRERKDLLRQLALSSAHRAVTSGENITLRPMSSYERRIIHNILGNDENVETESTGRSPGRRVVVKPKK